MMRGQWRQVLHLKSFIYFISKQLHASNLYLGSTWKTLTFFSALLFPVWQCSSADYGLGGEVHLLLNKSCSITPLPFLVNIFWDRISVPQVFIFRVSFVTSPPLHTLNIKYYQQALKTFWRVNVNFEGRCIWTAAVKKKIQARLCTTDSKMWPENNSGRGRFYCCLCCLSKLEMIYRWKNFLANRFSVGPLSCSRQI